MIPTIEQFVSNVVNEYIVRPTDNPNRIGVGGFLFDILDNEEVHLDAEITDHYVEDNYAIQDHIALRPVMFTLRGYIAELRDLQSQSLMPALTAAQSMASVGGFLPEFSVQATQMYSKITDVTSKINSVINQANNIMDIFLMKSTSADNQENAFKFFFDLFQSRQLCTVETPFQIFENMAISSVRAIQRGDTRIISDFAVTFKQIRKVSTISNVSLEGTMTGRIINANSEDVSSGQVSGKAVDVTILDVSYAGISI